jgi:Holliday junction resolvase
MTSPRASKAKGTSYERGLAEVLQESGVFPRAERAPRWGSKDKGDLVNVSPFCIEAKATKAIDLAGFLAEAKVETVHAEEVFPVVIIKRRQKPVLSSYVVMELEDWLELVRITQGVPCS